MASLADELLALARLLDSTQNSEAAFRRSVSTSYYSVFHLLIEASYQDVFHADLDRRFVRSFDHKEIDIRSREIYENAGSRRPFDFEAAFGFTTPCVDLVTLATNVSALMKARHIADYDTKRPHFGRGDSTSALVLAEACHAAVAALRASTDMHQLRCFLASLVIKKPRND
jgi:hypothetical protein